MTPVAVVAELPEEPEQDLDVSDSMSTADERDRYIDQLLSEVFVYQSYLYILTLYIYIYTSLSIYQLHWSAAVNQFSI